MFSSEKKKVIEKQSNMIKSQYNPFSVFLFSAILL